ncbi:hypothetical protein THAOC_03927, partial [Thalassiosira oceanica]
VASYYFRLGEYEKAAEIANGIIATDYGYFFKALGRLQEELANRNVALHVKREFYTGADDDADLLSVLSTDLVINIRHKRPMLDQSAETLVDTGIDATKAALCECRIRNLDLKHPHDKDTTREQFRYAQAGLVYLKQTLGQTDANNHERRKNYLMGLYQQARLLSWHEKLADRLRDEIRVGDTNDILSIIGDELETARRSLKECEELSVEYGYPYMLMLVGNLIGDLGDIPKGNSLVQRAIGEMGDQDMIRIQQILERHRFKATT